MKKLLTLVCLCLCTACFAQDVTIKKDIIYKDGEPYARLLKSGSIIHDFSIRTLDDEEILAAIHQGDGREYTITFMGSGSKATMQGGFSFAKTLAKELVISNIIKDGKLNPAGERRFLLLHPINNESGTEATSNTDASPAYDDNDTQPERNTSAPVMVFGSEISQDNTTIGSYKSRRNAADGTVYNVFSFYNAAGKKVAEASLENVGAQSAHIVIMRKDYATNIPVTAFDDMGIAKEIAAWLVKRRYL